MPCVAWSRIRGWSSGTDNNSLKRGRSRKGGTDTLRLRIGWAPCDTGALIPRLFHMHTQNPTSNNGGLQIPPSLDDFLQKFSPPPPPQRNRAFLFLRFECRILKPIVSHDEQTQLDDRLTLRLSSAISPKVINPVCSLDTNT